MIELIKFELKKIFSNKLIYIVGLVIAVFIVCISANSNIKTMNNVGTKEEIQSMAEEYMNGDYSSKDIQKLESSVHQKIRDGESITKEEEFVYYCWGNFSVADKNINEVAVEEINNSLDKLEENNKKDSFEYNKLLKEKEMIENLPEKESIYKGDWGSMLDFNVESTMKIILLALGLAGIFSKEYASRVSYLNLSTKEGKTKLNTAKLIAALIYATIVFAFITLLFAGNTYFLGLPNGDKPISFIMDSTYNISINQYFLYTLAFSYVGTILFALLIVLLSLLTRNLVLEFGLPIVILFVCNNFKLPDFTKYFNFAKLFSAKDVFGQFDALNVFGQAVLYPYVIGITGALAIIVMLLIYKKFGGKQTIA